MNKKQNRERGTTNRIERFSPLVSMEHSQGPLTRCQFFIEKKGKLEVITVLKNKRLLKSIAYKKEEILP